MSSTFDDASLVFIPSGYKTSKAYSVKPSDGSGDLTFSRSNDTATRVNSAGLIEKVRTNVALYSEDFTWGGYNKYQSTITGNTVIAPDGTTTADTITDNAVNDVHIAYQSISFPAGEYSISCYAKANTLSHAFLQIYNGTNFYVSGIFNLTNGTVSGAGSIISVGNGWYRISFTAQITAGVGFAYIGTSNGSSVAYVGTGQSIYIWGYQAETGVATSYIATTSAAVSVGPVANVPRLDYLNSSCPRLLLEPQRTNSLTYSEQFDNAAWTKSNATVTANTSVSPDGYTNADTVVINSGGYLYRDITSYSAVSGQSVTISVFAKNQINNFLIFGGATAAGTDVYKIENYGNGWYRHSVVRTFTTTATTLLQYLIATNMVGTHIIWGAQIEGSNSAYATSYIPTLGAAVTRGVDRALKSSVSSLIGQSAGTLYGEFTFDSGETVNRVFSITGADWNTDGSIRLDIISNKPEIYARKAGADIGSQGSINYTISKGQTIKWALVYTASTMKLFIDGAQRGTTTSLSTTPPACSELFVNELGGGFSSAAQNNQRTLWSQVLLFTSALSDADAAALTA